MKNVWRAMLMGAVLIGAPAVAQETNDGGLGIELGETIVDGRVVGTEYISETFGDWALRCVTTLEGPDPCQGYQLLLDSEGNRVAEISIFPINDGGQAVAGGTIVTPLETLLTRLVTIQIDSGPERRYPFAFCSRAGCVSRVGFMEADIDAMKRGAAGTLTIVPAGSPNTPVGLTMSLTGFTAVFNKLQEG